MVRLRGSLQEVFITDAVLWQPAGSQTARWARSMARNFERFAQQQAPVNKHPGRGLATHGRWARGRPYSTRGALKRSISAHAAKPGWRAWTVSLNIDAPYADYVLRGTADYTHPGNGMYIPGPHTSTWTYVSRRTGEAYEWTRQVPGPGDGGDARTFGLYKHRRGQRAQNEWLERAYEATARVHRSIPSRGFDSSMFGR